MILYKEIANYSGLKLNIANVTGFWVVGFVGA